MTHLSPHLSRRTSHPQTGDVSLYTVRDINYIDNKTRQCVIIYCNKIFFPLYSRTSVFSTMTVKSSSDV